MKCNLLLSCLVFVISGYVQAEIKGELSCPAGYVPGYFIYHKHFWYTPPYENLSRIDAEVSVYATQKVRKTVTSGTAIRPKADTVRFVMTSVEEEYQQTKWVTAEGVYTLKPLRNYAKFRKGNKPGTEVAVELASSPEQRKEFSGFECDWVSMKMTPETLNEFCQAKLYGRQTILYSKDTVLKDGRVYSFKQPDIIEHKCLKEDDVSVPEEVVWQ